MALTQILLRSNASSSLGSVAVAVVRIGALLGYDGERKEVGVKLQARCAKRGPQSHVTLLSSPVTFTCGHHMQYSMPCLALYSGRLASRIPLMEGDITNPHSEKTLLFHVIRLAD